MRFKPLLISLVTGLFVTPACAGEGWYLGFGTGWSTLDPVGFGISPAIGPASGRITFNDTAAADLTLGYKFRFPIRLETEIRYADFDANHLKIGAAPALKAKGDLAITSFLANAIYDVPLSQYFALSLGGGLGIGQADANLSDALHDRITGSNATFAWHALAGLSIVLSDQLDLGIDYRYQSADATSHNFVSLVSAPASLKAKNDQSIMLSLRWYVFAQPKAALPPPPPAPPPPPSPAPPPAAVKTFVIFFDFDKSDLTQEAVNVVAQAASATKLEGAARILVTGHTDTVGSETYNQALSERRAAAVKTQLVSDGLAGSDIATTGKGFSDPLVPTGPNAREPQNRRAVIDLGT